MAVFPFVKLKWGRAGLGPITRFVPPSPSYDVEQFNGRLVAFPFSLFGLVPLARVLRARPRIEAEPTGQAVTLLGGALLALAPLLMFVVAPMRYLAGAVPVLALGSILGWWQAYPQPGSRPQHQAGDWTATVLLVSAPMALGFLLAVMGYHARFEHLNPELFEWITRLLA